MLYTFILQDLVRWDLLTAGGVVTVIPVVIIFLLVQGRLVQGLTAGAIEG